MKVVLYWQLTNKVLRKRVVMDISVEKKSKIKSFITGGVCTIALIIAPEYVIPAWYWLINTIVAIGSSLSSTFSDELYARSANVHIDLLSLNIHMMGLILILILFIMFAVMRSMLKNHKADGFLVSAFYGVILGFTVGMLPSASRDISSHSIRAATLAQIDILKPYVGNTEELYSQFLLVQGKDDYMEVWNEIYTIAVKNDVVLARFKEKGELPE
ncbi:hypothetical protein AB4391_00390 [Vibrio lentus]|uniref:Uncharacterized protein n=1 Tax=Vibrio lentus TaxID=136468 RepID=A0A2N7K4K7_9VIBR|nr:hypothetical protein [Vibrio lentus]PMM69148.1 hypothetical protein BCT49_08190 [Vibrio lentus]